MLNADADDIRGSAATVSGPAPAVAEFTAGRVVWDRRMIGGQESAVVAGAMDDRDWAWARELRLGVAPLSLQQLVVYAAGRDSADLRERTSA